jgi:hypothetical protein
MTGWYFKLSSTETGFLHEAPNGFACAAFSKESRMNFDSANKLNRKFREKGVAWPGNNNR